MFQSIRLKGWDVHRTAALYRQLMTEVANWDGAVWWELHCLENPGALFGEYGCHHELPASALSRVAGCKVHEAVSMDWNASLHRSHDIAVYDWDGKCSENYNLTFGDVGGVATSEEWRRHKPEFALDAEPSMSMIHLEGAKICSRIYSVRKRDVPKLADWFQDRGYDTLFAYLEGNIEYMREFASFATPDSKR